MKKKIFYVIIFMTSLFAGCQKQETLDNASNRLIPEYTDAKTSNTFGFWFFAGHDGSKCPGCIMIAGHLMHKDCQGHGNQCRKATSVTLNQVGTYITATTTDTFGLTSEDFFLMPDRSLEYVDTNNNYVFLNIPGQLVYRDSTTLQFTFTGLSFTNKPLY